MNPEQLRQRLEWFQDLKFGFFVHWGIYSQWGCIESWPLVAEDTWARPDDLACWTERGRDLERFRADYRALNTTFNPTRFDPEAWAEVAAAAGTKYFVFTTKHHDGFCLWDTATTAYRTTAPDCPMHTSPRADAVRAAFDAFRARDFAIGVYYSKSDWHCPWYWSPDRPAPDRNPNYDTLAEPELWGQFTAFVHAQCEELLSGYGPVDLLWLDGGQVRPPQQDIRMDDLAAMGRRHQPGLIVVDRTVGGEHENYHTPEQEIPDEPLPFVWESCLTLGDQWSYKPDDVYKSSRRTLELLIEIVAKGGNLLLNIGPTPEGELPAEAVTILREVGAWLDVNGEAIYGSRAVKPYRDAVAAYTRRGQDVYALVMSDEATGRLPSEVVLPFRPDGPAHLLGGGELPTVATDVGVRVTLPPSPPVGPAIALRLARAVD